MSHSRFGRQLLLIAASVFIAPAYAESPLESGVVAPEPSPIIKALPGKLDTVEMFNSNSPEVVKNSGILLSTFPSPNMTHPEAHLEHLLKGEVNFFLHHINNRVEEKDSKTVYIALLVYNSSDQKANLKILAGASNLSQPDAPFVSLPAIESNDRGEIYAGPGDRSMSQILRGHRDAEILKSVIEIKPHQYALLLNQPIPINRLEPPINGRSAMVKIETDQPLYAATLASLQQYEDQAPTLEQWKEILEHGNLVTPREKAASEPGKAGPIIYGRVSGVQTGSSWLANIVNSNDEKFYDLGKPGIENFPLSTIPGHTFETKQIQSAPLVVRNKDTAYLANGNYAVHYSLRIPLRNESTSERYVNIRIQNPGSDARNNFYFNETQNPRVFFRGSIKVTSGLPGKSEIHFFHLVMHQGERGQQIFQKQISPSESEEVQVDFYYPPDATPPQVLTIESIEPVR